MTVEQVAERLRELGDTVYTFGAPGDRDHVAVWKRTSSEWTYSYLSGSGFVGGRTRSRLKAARMAVRLAELPSSERLTVALDEFH